MKKWLISIIILLFCLIIVLAIAKNSKNVEVETTVTEYTPQEEISEEQNRMTLLTLYFIDSNTGEIFPEIRKIDVKEILDNPYEKIMNYLLEGSQVEGMQKTIPEGTKLNKIELENENLIIDLSNEFVEKYEINSEEQTKVIKSVVNTFLELKEITSVTFLINGEKNEKLAEQYTKQEN